MLVVMPTFYLASEADSRSNRRSKRWTVQARTLDIAIFTVRMEHSYLIRGERGIYVSVIKDPTAADLARKPILPSSTIEGT